jgi:phage baseplate assembly protein W
MAKYTTLNILPSGQSSFVLEDVDVINASIYSIIFDMPGSDYFRPEFGLGAQGWLFSPYNDQIKGMRINQIRQAIKRWEPRIALGEISFTQANGVASITIQYSFTSGVLKNSGKFKFSLNIYRGGQ